MIEWLQNHMLPCAYKSIFGIDCPLCGAQRSFILLLQTDLGGSLKMYPPLTAILIFFLLQMLYFFSNKRIVGKALLTRYSFFVLAFIFANYIFKMSLLLL